MHTFLQLLTAFYECQLFKMHQVGFDHLYEMSGFLPISASGKTLPTNSCSYYKKVACTCIKFDDI